MCLILLSLFLCFFQLVNATIVENISLIAPARLVGQIIFANGSDGFFEPCLADTRWGVIPSKCKDGKAYVPYGGREHIFEGNNYATIEGTIDEPIMLIPNEADMVPPNGAIFSRQLDQSNPVYACVAETRDGLYIPGKRHTGWDGYCFYAQDGDERSTRKYSWIVKVTKE